MSAHLYAYTVAGLGVLAFKFLHLPLPWLLGPIFSCLIAALLGVPMRARLGLRVAPAAGALKLVQFAYEELGLLHHVACLAGKHSPRPSEVLKAAGLGPLDANFGPIFLAEHVPEAA